MIVRLLKPEERFDAAKISTVAFHGRIDDIEKARENSLKETVEDWGAFSDDGKIMGRIINNAYTVHLDGTQVSCGGSALFPRCLNTGKRERSVPFFRNSCRRHAGGEK